MGRTYDWEDFTGRGEDEDIFGSQKRQEALDAGGEADGGEDEVWGRDAIMEDP